MSKKKNKKFKRTTSSTSSINNTPKTEIIDSTKATITETPVIQSQEKAAPKDEIEILNEKYKPIRKDIKKLGIVLASLIVLFVVIYIIDGKTGFLGHIGNWVYKITNIQTQ